MAELGSEQEAKDEKVVEVAPAGSEAATASAEEAASSGSETAEEVEKKEEAAPIVEKPKKFTDEDMKKLREKYQGETRQERDARIAAETEARVLREVALGKKPTEVVAEKQESELQRPVRPKEGDFGTREEFEAAMDKYEDDRDRYRDTIRAAEEEKKATAAQRENSKKAFEDAIVKQVEEGIKAHEDFKEVVVDNENLILNPVMALAISRRDNGHEVQYFLGKNPAEATRIAAIKDPMDVAAEIGVLSRQLKGDKPIVEGEPKGAASQKTKAPKPAATVAAKAKVSTDTSLEGKTQAERMALLEEESTKRRLAGKWNS